MPASTVRTQRSRRRPLPRRVPAVAGRRRRAGAAAADRRPPRRCARCGRLSEVAQQYGDGDVHLTGRANLQLRAMPVVDDVLPAEVGRRDRGHRAAAVAHPRAGPQRDGLAADRARRRPRPTCARSPTSSTGCCAPTPRSPALPGRFLFVLDDGRGDLVGRTLRPRAGRARRVAGAAAGRRRLGAGRTPRRGRRRSWSSSPRRFLAVRGDGPDAPWHVDELADAAGPRRSTPDPRTDGALAAAAYGPVPAATHVEVPRRRPRPRARVAARRARRAGGDAVARRRSCRTEERA